MMQHGLRARQMYRDASPVWMDAGDFKSKSKSKPYAGTDHKKSRSQSSVSDVSSTSSARTGWLCSSGTDSASKKKSSRSTTKPASQSSGSEADSLDSQNSMVQQQVRQVMGDLVSVLGELRTVVGDIKTLVTQIDVVTHRIDESVSGDESKRRASDSKVGPDKPRTKTKSGPERPSSYHSSTPDTTTSRVPDRTYVNLTYSTDGKLLDTGINKPRVDNQTFHNNNNNYGSNNNNTSSLDNKLPDSVIARNDQNNIVISKSTKPPKPVKPARLCLKSKRKEHALSALSLDDSIADSSPDSLLLDENPRVSAPRVSYRYAPASSTAPSSTAPTSEASVSPVSDYSGLYEREMEDCLELEISDCHDLEDETTHSRDSRQSSSDDYADWGARQLDIARKQAEVVAWTRSSWAGHELYRVSVDNSVGYSDDVTDGEQESEQQDAAAPQWNRFLPPTMNQHVVNFSWRTVVEP